ncbi:MAG: 16S rRNA (guanine(966)-N(2))-methyltransferase RsmD [bacterium]
MRIGGGEFRGRILHTPSGDATRPTSGMVRETLFNILTPLLPEARILDLYAGSGSVGLEALSRGAAYAVFCENAHSALKCLKQSITELELEDYTETLPIDVNRALEQLSKSGEKFDIIFLDPPFADVEAYNKVLEQVGLTLSILAAGGLCVAQHYRRVRLPDAYGLLSRTRVRDIGDNVLTFYRLKE